MATVTVFPVPAPKRRRTRPTGAIEPGIWRTATGFRAFVDVKGETFSKRWPAIQRLPDGREHPTTITEIRDWRAKTRTDELARLRKRDGKPITPGTFAEDVRTVYLPSVVTMASYKERVKHMEEWITHFGERRTEEIQSVEIRTVLAALHKHGKPLIKHTRDLEGRPVIKVVGRAGYAESSVNNRRTALMHFFTTVNGRDGRNPVRDTEKLAETVEARGKPMAIVQAILDALEPSKTKARLWVIGWSGIPHKTLWRVKPEHVDYVEQVVFLHGRDKGKGTRSRTQALMPQALQGFKMMQAFDAWGCSDPPHVDRHGQQKQPERVWQYLAKAVARACRRLKIPVMTAYDFRHSFGTFSYVEGKDLDATRRALGQVDMRSTQRYTLAAADPSQRAMFEAMQAKFPMKTPKAARRATATRRAAK